MRLVDELKRRKVLRVAALYASAAFATMEGLDLLVAGFGVGPAVHRAAAVVLTFGFPIVVGLSWAFDWRAGGLRATAPADTPEGEAELAAAAALSWVDRRTVVVAGTLVVFGLGLGTGFLLRPSADGGADEGPSIAVLPFENRSSDRDAEFFVDGIHDELMNQLSKIAALRVISRASVMGYRANPKPIRQVGQELGVRTVLSGGVQRAGNAVRVSVQLVDARLDAELWAQSYEQSLSPENIFAIQRDVSERISEALRARLTSAESDALAAVPTENQEAYDLYLLGNAAYDRDRAEAAERFQAAVELDPGFALAWAQLSLVLSARYQFFEDRSQAGLDRAKAALDRAFALQPDLPEAWRASGFYHYWGYRDFDRALSALDRAEAGLPGDGQVLSGKAAILRRVGRVEEGIRAYARAAQVNPLSTSPLSNLASLYAHARIYEESSRLRARLLALDPTDQQSLIQRGSYDLLRWGRTDSLRAELSRMGELEDWNRVITIERWRVEYFDGDHERARFVLDSAGYDVLAYQTYYYPTDMLRGLSRAAEGEGVAARRDFERARRHLEQALARTPDEPRMLASLGRTLAGLRESEAALRFARRAVEVNGPKRDALEGPNYVLELVATLATLGRPEEAIEQLVVYFGGLGAWSPGGLARHPDFATLADHPRWAEVEAAAAAWDARMERAGLR